MRISSLFPFPTILLVAAVITGCAMAPRADNSSDGIPKVVSSFAQRNNLQIGKQFDVAPNIRAYTLENVRGGKGLIYVVDGQHAFIGNMVGPEGESITKMHLQTQVYDLKGAYQRLVNESKPITDDSDTPIFGFYDPQCHYCVEAIERFRDVGVTVKWVPVMMFGQKSIDAVAAIYAAENEAVALVDAAAAQKAGQLDQWISKQTYGTANVRDAVDRISVHESIMHQAGISGTPTFLVKIENDVIPMMTSDILAMRERFLQSKRAAQKNE